MTEPIRSRCLYVYSIPIIPVSGSSCQDYNELPDKWAVFYELRAFYAKNRSEIASNIRNPLIFQRKMATSSCLAGPMNRNLQVHSQILFICPLAHIMLSCQKGIFRRPYAARIRSDTSSRFRHRRSLSHSCGPVAIALTQPAGKGTRRRGLYFVIKP